MDVDGWELRERRIEQGLTAAQVARATGTATSNVAAYERGDKRPDSKTLRRLVAAIDAGAESPIHRASLLTVPATAAAIRRDVRTAGRSTGDTLRFVREMINNAEFAVGSERDRMAYFAEPSTTGDRRWDALLAGVTALLAQRHGFGVPAWTTRRAVRPFWFVGSTDGLHALAYAHSPVPLAVRGVFIDPADLESV